MNSLPAKPLEPNLPHKLPQLSRATMLGRAGFTKLFNLTGGHKAWKDAGLPLDKN